MKNLNENQQALAANIKRLRRERGWKQPDLAERADLSLGAIRQIETCQRWPKPGTLNKIAAAFGVPSIVLTGNVKISTSSNPANLEEMIRLWLQADQDTREEALDRLRKGIELASDSPKRKLNHIR